MNFTTAILLIGCCLVLPKGTSTTNDSPLMHVFISVSVSQGSNLRISENNGSSVFVELLRGRDGLPGRDGLTGERGPPGRTGRVGPPGLHSGGAMYTRWGKSSCPQVEGTEMVYSGITGGTHHSHTGGGANYLCMPQDPQYSPTLTYRHGQTDATNGYASRIYRAEYEFPLQGTHNHNVPCAVCHVLTRPSVMMIPAKYRCPSTWTREYYGYIMAEYKGSSSSVRGPTMFECVDQDQESLRNSVGDHNGVLFYHTEASCSSGQLPCPPYDQNKELNCVVCTK
jgi:hypothetical protein